MSTGSSLGCSSLSLDKGYRAASDRKAVLARVLNWESESTTLWTALLKTRVFVVKHFLTQTRNFPASHHSGTCTQ